MSDKRIIEQPASEEIFHDDWLVKDSSLNETTKIQASVFMALIVEQAKDGMVPYTMLATEWTALTTYYKDQVVIYNGELYRAKDTNVSPTFNPSAWTKISFDTLYRTTLADVKNSICEEWSTSTAYTLNDCAIHEDKLYKCVADTATVGTWVSNEWELVSIYEIIQNLPKSASDVTYDNTESGLESENVQDALDEVAETITELSNTTEVTGTASGAIATFTDGADAPLKELKVAVTPYQDLHGYDGPWAGGAGKNKFDSDTVLSTFTKNNNKYVGMPSYVVDNYVISGGFKTNTRYTLSYKAYNNTSTSSNFRFIFSYTDETEEIIGGFVDTTTEKVIVGTSAENKTISKIKRNYGNGVELTLYDIQLEEGSTATSFAPYSNICPISGWDEAVVTVADDAESPTTSHEYTIDLDGTRYGGKVDLVSGVMTVEKVELDLGSRTYNKSSDGYFYCFTTDLNFVSFDKDNPNAECEIYKLCTYAEYISKTVDSAIFGNNNSHVIYIADSRFTDVNDLKTALNGVKLVYELATPLTIQLTPTQVKSLEGTNNIFANCGDIKNVEYVRNLNITINDLLSRING